MSRAIMSEETNPFSWTGPGRASGNREETDLDLLQKCQDPNRAVSDVAFEELVARYGPRLYRMAYRILGDRFEAWDICQETFVRVFTSLRRFDERLSFYTWLYRIGMNLTIDTLRRRRVRRSVELVEPEQHASKQLPPDEILQGSERAHLVQEVLSGLPEKYRIVLALRDMEGFTPREIAKIIHVPSSLVRWRLHHARKLFKDLWSRRSDV
ncbi:MAG: sigma-70 family RNA polymerase sigma factor [Planctomycetes bacterium]|nr:sigma-70 family RNA polymerase sigma factor [Planctomycetota bacterium]